MQRIPPELTAAARALRTSATPAEVTLWRHLRRMRPRFTRQLVVDRYILDFACRTLKPAVELDGGQHALQADADAIRTAYLEGCGWTVLRFWNTDILSDPEAAIAVVEARVARLSTHPDPSRPGRGFPVS